MAYDGILAIMHASKERACWVTWARSTSVRLPMDARRVSTHVLLEQCRRVRPAHRWVATPRIDAVRSVQATLPFSNPLRWLAEEFHRSLGKALGNRRGHGQGALRSDTGRVD